MYKRSVLIGLMLSTGLTVTISATAQDTSTVRLFGGLSHSEDVPHVDKALQPHRDRFAIAPAYRQQAPITVPVPDDAIPPAVPLTSGAAQTQQIQQPPPQQQPTQQQQQQRYIIEWFKIPTWMGGVWVKDGDLTTQVTNLRTGTTRSINQWIPDKLEARWGHQVDRQGNIWHVNILPAERDGTSENKKVRFVTTAQRCERTAAQELVTRTHYVVSESDIWTGRSIDMFQQESLNHYTPAGPNDLANNSSNRVFTYEGQPVRDGQLQSKFRKTANFAPVEFLQGVNLRTSLADYLTSLEQSQQNFPVR